MVERRGRATPMAPEERRQAIVDAVVPLLLRHGPTVTTKQIAEAAGVAEGTIFRVFADKHELLLAAAEETVTPSDGDQDLASTVADLPDLHTKVAAVVEHLVARMERVTLVMMALRTLFITEGPRPSDRKLPPGPPPFLRDANKLLIDRLTELVFQPHRRELRVPPERAALLLRSLVFGAWHPGMEHSHMLSGEEIADALLHGVARGKRGRD